ncbi:RNA polymerase factor sigma-54 [Taibaiella lutea]|uniref:RNA polymerase factor sigma-54 n=1 Tax=Taibaiella lutea TaxID=2608001 RepID=A0A5M6CMN5_9BACT|nr:RNA polymerase factor sigma-54 [Taibaiella lutea]KAA5536287.1 RNA polymerase factor sigma-54 [Taibaiella lutea]
MLRQTQTQKLTQKLSPQQIQLMKLLQVPTSNLEERIKDELENNPALDTGSDKDNDPYGLNENEILNKEKYEGEEEHQEGNDELENFDVSEYLREEGDMQSDHHLYEGRDDDDEPMSNPVRVETTFTEYLTNQMGMLDLDERRTEIAEQIIGSIDDDGYLRRDPVSIADDLAFNRNIATDEKEVKELIKKIQNFDPPGVAAMDLRECLLLQLERLDFRSQALTNAMLILDEFFEEFTRKHYDRIIQKLKIDEDEFRDAINIILKLTPKPGSAYSGPEEAGTYIIPDFFIYNNNGILELTLNARNAPELRVSEGYRDMLKTYDSNEKQSKSQRDALVFIKQKIDAAKWFIDAIKQRQHTLLVTMNAILEYQAEFFLTGDEASLRPMILKDIADKINMDISTVSRVASSKYVQCEYGTFILKFFFSEAIVNDSGEEVSTREVKRILTKFINEEDKQKPLSDERLMELIAEQGFNVARRTVAKYREQMEIPVARLRRQV